MSDTENKTEILLANPANIFVGYDLSAQSVAVGGDILIAKDLGIFAATGWCVGFLSATRKMESEMFHSEQMLSAVMSCFLTKAESINIYGALIRKPNIDLQITYENLNKEDKKGKKLQTAKRAGRTRLLVSHSDMAKRFDLMSIADFVRKVERMLQLDTSAFYSVDGQPNAYAVVASNVWMESPAMLSLFGLLLRTGEAHTMGTSALDTIDKVSKGGIATERLTDRDVWARSRVAFARMLQIGYRPYFYIDPVKNFRDSAAAAVGNDWLAFAEGHGTVKHWSRKELKDYPTVQERQKAREAEAARGDGELGIAKELMEDAKSKTVRPRRSQKVTALANNDDEF